MARRKSKCVAHLLRGLSCGMFLWLASFHSSWADTKPVPGVGGFWCFAKNVEFLDLAIGQQAFHVPARDIFLMKPCKEGGDVEFFSVDKISKFSLTIGFNKKQPESAFKARLQAHASALKDAPKNSFGLANFAEQSDDITVSYVGFSANDDLIYLRCFRNKGEHPVTCTAYTSLDDGSIDIDYYFMEAQISDWKSIDTEARAYARRVMVYTQGAASKAVNSRPKQLMPTEAALAAIIQGEMAGGNWGKTPGRFFGAGLIYG